MISIYKGWLHRTDVTKILLVDDDQDFLDLTRAFLEREEDFNVITNNYPLHALRRTAYSF